MEHITNSSKETVELGRNFIKRFYLNQGETLAEGVTFAKVFALYGELGSGKTTFVQGLARGLGIKQRIISPTFIIIREYKVSPPRSPFGHLGGGEATTSTPVRCSAFYHVDLYRVENERGIEGLGLEEILGDPENIVAVEWAEKVKNILPRKRIDIYFEYLEENKRKITI